MRDSKRLLATGLIVVPVCAFAFIAWADHARIRRVEFVSKVASEEARIDPASPTGYAEGRRWLVVPEHNNPTYQWIEETQLMMAQGQWRVRWVAYENAPFGREVHSASPYRWWLGLIACVDHSASGRPPGKSLEGAALVADPLLHMLLLAGTALFVAWQFGVFPAAIVSIGLVALFPLAAQFLPGAPDDHGLARACAIWSLLPLLAGIGGS